MQMNMTTTTHPTPTPRLLRPRWKKVLGDLWSNKTRTALVVLSIFIGVFAVGVIGGAQITLPQAMNTTYRESRPAHALISVPDEDSFHDQMVQNIRDMEGVADAEGQATIGVQAAVGAGQWMDTQMIAMPDYEEMRIAAITPERGAWPPPDKAVLVERAAIGFGPRKINAEVGDTIVVERADGKRRTLTIAGVVHDVAQAPPSIANTLVGYISFDTLEWLGGSRNYTQVQLRFRGTDNSVEENRARAEAVYEKLQKSGRDPAFPETFQPDDHWANDFVTSITALMGMLAVLSIILSGFLVTNTISALLAQQTRQIGILKAIGANPRQIVVLYVVLVLCFGLIAFILALLLTPPATAGFVRMVMTFFNVDPPGAITIPTGVTMMQAAVSLGVPVVASLIPVFKGTRITVREAMDSAGIQQSGGSNQQRGWFGRGCAALMQAISSVMSRPLLISLRNTLRRKGRVALTLVTLTLGGAVFIAVLSVQSSLDRTVDDLLHSLYGFDMQVTLADPERAAQVVTEVQRVPGVAVAESWSLLAARRVLADGGEGESLTLFGVPPETQMMHPTITEGRWLLPDDESALVASVEVLNDNPDLGVGDTMTLTINDREEQWTIVGAMVTMQGMPNAYTPFDYFGRVTHDVGRTRMVMVKTMHSDMAFVSTVAEELEAHLQRWSIEVSTIILMPEQRDSTKMVFNIIVGALLAMALIIAAVGGLGLAGTMSLNVLERTREIGVMRAIGASNAIVLQVVMLEGIILGLISWGIGALLAFPMSTLLIGTVGSMLLGTSLSFTFSVVGLWIWLAVVLVLAAVASFVPAWNAAQISVREVLAHE